MKIVKKAVAAALAAGMIITAAGCADTSWSYKDDKYTLPIGTYIYYMTGAYSYAQQEAQKQVEVATDADGATQPTEAADVMSAKIKDNDDKEVTGRDYMLNTAQQSSKTLIYTLEKFDELGLKLTDAQQTQIDSLASQGWIYSGASYEKLGVSESSYKLAYAEFSTKYEAVFKAMYGEGGEKEVSDDDLKKYYTAEYVDYSYIPINLYKTSESTDATSDSSSTASEALSDDEIKKIQTTFDGYKNQLNKGEKTFDEIDKAFMEYQSLDKSTAVSAQEILDNSSAPTDIINAVKELKNNQAEVITVGEGNTAVMYLVYRGDISTKTSNLDDENTRYSVLTNMKKDEYNDYMDTQANKLELTENEAALNQFTPEEIEKKLNEINNSSSSNS
ncbi:MULTISPECIES: hypothetical protein [unclassified Ruminococcus]|uniref:hypothetical protein n=1 Tax=unclassified Ruminococcus TaxID=2608920 RepID=UPI00210EABF0|nr:MULTISPECIES: hypothetical protein [unclassified Ruminococcus]MCQ4021461.1 hypothetical protein [Ruminococcus sp. zg-924]MCQ4113906.1 hypothetical protein [Ruminococcus sp. zg-921]